MGRCGWSEAQRGGHEWWLGERMTTPSRAPAHAQTLPGQVLEPCPRLCPRAHKQTRPQTDRARLTGRPLALQPRHAPRSALQLPHYAPRGQAAVCTLSSVAAARTERDARSAAGTAPVGDPEPSPGRLVPGGPRLFPGSQTKTVLHKVSKGKEIHCTSFDSCPLVYTSSVQASVSVTNTQLTACQVGASQGGCKSNGQPHTHPSAVREEYGGPARTWGPPAACGGASGELSPAATSVQRARLHPPEHTPLASSSQEPGHYASLLSAWAGRGGGGVLWKVLWRQLGWVCTGRQLGVPPAGRRPRQVSQVRPSRAGLRGEGSLRARGAAGASGSPCAWQGRSHVCGAGGAAGTPGHGAGGLGQRPRAGKHGPRAVRGKSWLPARPCGWGRDTSDGAGTLGSPRRPPETARSPLRSPGRAKPALLQGPPRWPRAGGGVLWVWVAAATLLHAGGLARGDCWLIEGDKGFVWLAICSQNQPPYEAIPQQINSSIVDLRLNENRIRSVQYATLSRFGNLTYLNLTKNEIGYIEDGAFAGQFNLQVLQLGYNRLRNLTEGVLRGLGKLEYLYLQANLIEVVTASAFWECPSLVNVDLSMNRIQRLHSATFAGLTRLSVCELYSNPFYCSCELLGFLRWLAAFTNATQTYDRMQCESPPLYSGYFLLGQGRPGHHGHRSILSKLQSVCTDGADTAGPRPGPGRSPPPPPPPPPPEPSDVPCADDECFSGDGTTPRVAVPTLAPQAEARPLIKVKQLTQNSATVTVQLPSPFTRMYTLEQFNHSRSFTVSKLTKPLEEIRLTNLHALTNYTYCVVSSSSGLHHNHTCLTICLPQPPGPPGPGPSPSTATHYIMTVLGCLFGMVLVLGAVYYCLRRRRRQEEKHKKAAAAADALKKTIIELKYGPEMEAPGLAPLAQGPLLGPEAGTHVPYEPKEYQLVDSGSTPKVTKGDYMEVRAAEQALGPDGQGSAAEISTIAREVDKVNQIINNCIDALKSEAAAFPGAKAGPAEPPLVLLAEPLAAKHGFLAPVFQDSLAHGLQRHPGLDTAPAPARSPRALRTDPTAAEAAYIEKTSPAAAILTVTPAAAVLRAEAEKARQLAEHRHSYPGPHPAEPPAPPPPPPPPPSLAGLGGRKPSLLEPLTRPRPRDLAYSQLSPQYHHLGYASSPESGCGAPHGIWGRFRLSRRRPKDREEFVAAGHALRKKVQFAKDEDLHDILDYWKGVSAQHKS
ncbi:protein ELFN1 [Tamandua tetradactyla]|uniref:protein ELFN1 n=1 Tax=Tamandua tetradactyla TaxID=48850 RepID=UPI0040542A46